MASTHNPSLFSSYKTSKISSYCRQPTKKFVVGSVGKSRGRLVHIQNPEIHRTRNQNVAIATQVLNPSAIGGSLKCSKFSKHFGRRDDDEVSLFRRKPSKMCGNVMFYGVSIFITVIMITGLVIAIGCMKNEKDKISTRPVKLAQGQYFDQYFEPTTTTLATPVLHGTSTTERTTPPSKFYGDEDDIDEISLDDYDPGYLDKKVHHGKGSFTETFKQNNEPPLTDDYPDYIYKDEIDNVIPDEYLYKEHPSNVLERLPVSITEDVSGDSVVSPGSQNTGVRVIPPPSAAFEGISFGFPIYQTNKSQIENVDILVPLYSAGDANNTQETAFVENLETEPAMYDDGKELLSEHSNHGFTSSVVSADSQMHFPSQPQYDNENYANTRPVLTSTVVSNPFEDNNENYPHSALYNGNSPQLSKKKPLSNGYETPIDFNANNGVIENGEGNGVNENNKGFSSLLQNQVEDSIPIATLQTDIFLEDFEASASSEESELETPPTRRPSSSNRSKLPTGRKFLKGKISEPNGYFRPGDSRGMRFPSPVVPIKNKNLPNSKKQKQKKVIPVVPTRSHHEDPTLLSLLGATNSKVPESFKMPILDYKVDFSKILPSSTVSPETSILPNSFSEISQIGHTTERSYELQAFIDKQTKKNFPNSYAAASPTTIAPVGLPYFPSVITTPQTIPENSVGGSYLGITSPTGASLSILQHPQTQDHLLIPNSHTNAFSFDTAATSSTFTNPQNFQLNPIGTNNNYQPPTSNNDNFFQSPTLSSFSTELKDALPYPDIGLPNGFHSISSSPAASSGPSSSYVNSKKMILTTGNGQVPNYNTITQGIHLLSLLSGQIPEEATNYFANSNGHGQKDSLYQVSANPLTASLEALSPNPFSTLQSNSPNLLSNGHLHFPSTPSSLLHGLAAGTNAFHPRNNFRSFDGKYDQLTSASVEGVTSILSRLPNITITVTKTNHSSENELKYKRNGKISSSWREIGQKSQVSENLNEPLSPEHPEELKNDETRDSDNQGINSSDASFDKGSNSVKEARNIAKLQSGFFT